MQRIALVTDAWHPQVNGVVTTLTSVVRELEAMGREVKVIHPGLFLTVPMPSYREIKLAAAPYRGVAKRLEAWRPDAVHIATEGPCGLAARAYCLRHGWRFTTSLHTKFPEYVNARWPMVPVRAGYGVLRRFHAPAARTMVCTPGFAEFLGTRGFGNLRVWTRGVDTEQFRPGLAPVLGELPRPLFAYLGRVAVEKNIEAFLDLDLPGSKLVIGDGPARRTLQARYPAVHWAGMQGGAALAQHVASADCVVFPSLTDTYGLVMIEAMACGVPVAAFPVTGPKEVVSEGVTGVLDSDLRRAALAALDLDSEACRAAALERSWSYSADQFAANLVNACSFRRRRRRGLPRPRLTLRKSA